MAMSPLRLRIEVGLIAHGPEAMKRAQTVTVEVRRLAQARAGFPAGRVPDSVVGRCRNAGEAFRPAAVRNWAALALSGDYRRHPAPRLGTTCRLCVWLQRAARGAEVGT